MSKTSQGMDVSKMAAEGFGQIMNSMDFFKKAWSNLATPFTPTLDVEELDKRIADLRAVEQWLSLNQNLLRSTIQGLEIQRGTLDAINTVSSNFSSALKPADDTMGQTLARFAAAAAQKSVEPAAPESAGSSAARPFGFFDWSPFGMPSSALPGAHTAASSRAGAEPEPPAADAEDEDDEDQGAEAESAAEADSPAQEGDGGRRATAGARGTGATASDQPGNSPVPGVNPLAWWEMLQDNFRQIAQAATSDYPRTSTGSPAGPFAFPVAGANPFMAAGGGKAAEPAAGPAAGKRRGSGGSGASGGRGAGSGSGGAKAPKAARSRTSATATGGKAGPEASRAKPRRRKASADKDPG